MTCEDTHLWDLLGLKTLKAGREQGPAGSQQWTLEGYSRDGLLQGTFPGFQVKYFLDLIASVTSDLKLSVPFELSPITIPFSLLVPVLILCVLVVTQSHLTLCDPMDCSPLVCSVHGILQARTLGWVAISFSRGSSRPRDQTQVSCIAG